jgi:hypothetical protein
MTEKEASYRYGYSQHWFRRERCLGPGPPFIKIRNGKILYEVEMVDKWFFQFPLQTRTNKEKL